LNLLWPVKASHDLPLLDDRPDRVRTDADEIDRRSVHDHCVHLLARFEAAHAVVAIERIGRVDCRADERFLECQIHAEAGERHRKRDRGRKTAAGIDVGGERHGDAVVDQHAARRETADLQIERRDRQQRRNHARGRQAPGTGLVDKD
jgi:hypothetical protein